MPIGGAHRRGIYRAPECSMGAKAPSFLSKWQRLRFFFHPSGGCSCLTLDALLTVLFLSLLPGRGSNMRCSVHSIYHNNATESCIGGRHATPRPGFALIHLSEVGPLVCSPHSCLCWRTWLWGKGWSQTYSIHAEFAAFTTRLFCTSSVKYPFHLRKQMTNGGS